MSIETKAIEVLERAGYNTTSLPCSMCALYSQDLFLNVKFVGFCFERKKDKNLLTEKFLFCPVNLDNKYQKLQDLFYVIKENKIEIFGADYDFIFTSEPCPYFNDIRLENFKVLISYEKEI